MTLAELGELLREARVHRGFSVDEVASRLKITSRMVRAIEEGDASSFPHAVYARGFIRSYASLVDVDEEVYRPALLALADPQETPSVPEPPVTRSSGRRSGKIIPFLIVAGCCLGFAAYWQYRTTAADTAQTTIEPPIRAIPVIETPPPVPAPAVPPANAAPAEPRAANATSAISTPANTASFAATTAVAAAATVTSVPAANAATSTVASGVAAHPENEPVRANGFSTPQAEATPPAERPTLTLQDGVTQTDVTNAGKGKHQVILSAQQECWVHSTADSTDTRQFSLKKGEVFALSFDRKLTLKLGNAGGVRIKYDGEELPPPGALGQVRSLSFPPQS